MDKDLMRAWLETQAEISFARSGGPGGQNVNKVNTKAELRVDLARLEGPGDAERARLLEKLAPRLVGAEDGQPGTELLVQVQDTRSQWQNRRLAVERVMEILERALHRDKPRRATKPSRASQERRVASKKVVAAHKKNRGRPGLE